MEIRRLRLLFVAFGILALHGQVLFAAPSWMQDESQSESMRKVESRYWDDGTLFDSKIPTPREHFGFEVGHRHLDHAQVVGYLRRIVDLSDRMTIRQYAKSHGGRPLYLVTITSQKNRRRLKQIRQNHLALTRPNPNVDLSDLPAVINMGYGVHGDESSATNCTPLVIYYLAAAQSSEVKQWLNDCVIQLDPSLNPDGFNRFANWANRYRGKVVNPDPRHAEHNQMWPPGRVNYYWFDLNRDWLPLVHPESRGRLNNFHQWKPNVVLDFHEMGTGSTYFFQPGIPERTNPLTPPRNQTLTRQFARFHAKKLDQIGSLYFTQERFDDFYMGKGSTYPDLHGAIGILFEQASSRGHVQQTDSGLLAFHDTIKNQFTTTLTSLQATTALRMELLRYKKSFYEASLRQAAKAPIKTYVFKSAGNESRLNKFATLLKRHDIQCFRLSEDVSYGDSQLFASETLVVPAVQSENRFLLSLLQRRTNFRENIFYDVSTWTLPLAYGLEQQELKGEIDATKLVPFKIQAVNRSKVSTGFKFNQRAVAYAIDFADDAACELMVRLLRAKVEVRVATKGFETKVGDQVEAFQRGTLVVLLQKQKNKHQQIQQILRSFSGKLKIREIRSGLSSSGPDMGSSNFSRIRLPKLAMLSGASISSYSAGETWHYLDNDLRMPVTILKSRGLSSDQLSEYTCLIVPDGALSEATWAAVQNYAQGGGQVVVIGRQAVNIQGRLRASDEQGKKAEAMTEASGSIQQPFDSVSNKRALQLISGAIFSTEADLTHPLMFGVSKSQKIAVFRNHNQFLKPSNNVYRNPLIYSKSPLMAGYCSGENQKKFADSASIVIEPSGKGQFILMADIPNFRGFWHATRRIFFNAVFWGEKSRVR